MNRLVEHVSVSVLLIATIASATAHAWNAHGSTSVDFVWRKSCGAPSGVPLLEVHVLEGGAVIYDGGPLVKETGRHELAVPARAAGRLRRAAERAVTEPEAQPNSQPLPTDYCLAVRVGDRPARGLTVGRVNSPARSALVRSLERELHLTEHMCPLPGGGFATPFYAPNYCDESAFIAVFGDEKDCYSTHAVDVYANGLVHYTAEESKAGPPVFRKNLGDQLYMIGKTDLRELYAAVRRLTPIPSSSEPPPLRRNGKPLQGRGTPLEMKAFREEIARHVPIRWFAIPDPVFCRGGIESSVLVNDGAGFRLVNAR